MRSQRAVLLIDGMRRQADEASTLEQTLERLPGVAWVRVNLLVEAAYIEYDAAAVTPQQLIESVERQGFVASKCCLR
jgi:copper chaperone CopZ